jgi:hypothetical protein
MGARPSQQLIKRHLNRLVKKYSGVEFRVLYASNGEVAILPVNPATGEAECADPQVFIPADPAEDALSPNDKLRQEKRS